MWADPAGALSVCNGMDLIRLTRSFDRTADAMMTSAMRTLVLSKRAEVEALADAAGVTIGWGAIEATTSARDFEAALMLPIYSAKYATLDEYLKDNSSVDALGTVSVPTLCLASLDDPLIPEDVPRATLEASRSNPNVWHVATERGGHLGWMAGWSGARWSYPVMWTWMEAVLAETERERRQR